MTTETTTALDEERIGAFVGQVLGELGATLNAALVVIGDRLGLYKAMAGAGAADRRPSWPSAPARASATCASGSTRRRPAATSRTTPVAQRYTLPPEHAVALADEASPYFMPGAFELMTASVRDEPSIREAFRSGAGVGWHEHSHGVFDGCERFFRPGYAAQPRAVVDPGARRRRGEAARGRDAWPTSAAGTAPRRILMAQAYPASTLRRASTTTAPRSSGRASAPRPPASSDRVRFEVAPAAELSRRRLRPRHDASTACTTWAIRSAPRATCSDRSTTTAPG